jgi:mRNA-degrading endonuclease RelE of RelBE toxin-antitoxin system
LKYKFIPTKLFLQKLKKLDKSIVIELESKLESIKKKPIVDERRMHHAHNYFRVYIKNFRLIYKVEDEIIYLFDIRKRKEGYSDLK